MRIRVFLLALVGVLLVCLPLFAVEETPFSVGIYALQDDSASLLHLVEEAGSVYANQFLIPSVAYKANFANKKNAEIEFSTLKRITAAYASKSEKDLLKARETPSDPITDISGRLAITYGQIPYQQGYASLLQSYPNARSWYASLQKLDAIILLKKSKLASNDRLRLYWYDLYSDTTTLIFDKVVMQKDPTEMLEEIGTALLVKTAGFEYGLLIFDNYKSSVAMEANGASLLIKERQELFISGEYTVRLSGEGYIAKEMKVRVLPNTITHVPASLERSEGGDIHLFSPLGKVNWFVDGSFLDTTCDLSIGSSQLPLVVVAQKEGFANKTLQIQRPVKEIAVTLKPEWMTSSAILQDEQRLFYKSFRNTMLFFGLYVASSTLSRTFDEANPLWQPLQVATSGFALVSTLQTIMNLASYVALASSGVR